MLTFILFVLMAFMPNTITIGEQVFVPQEINYADGNVATAVYVSQRVTEKQYDAFVEKVKLQYGCSRCIKIHHDIVIDCYCYDGKYFSISRERRRICIRFYTVKALGK